MIRKESVRVKHLFVFLAVLMFVAFGWEAERLGSGDLGRVRFADIQTIKSVKGLISPDGERVLYTIEEIDRASDESPFFDLENSL